jgi:hypothetical protein
MLFRMYLEAQCPGVSSGQPDRCSGPGSGTTVFASYFPPVHGGGSWATIRVRNRSLTAIFDV